MASTTLFPTEQQNLTVYQSTDLQFSLVVRTSTTDNSPLDIIGFNFLVRFFREGTSPILAGGLAIVDLSVTGQVNISLPKESLIETEENTVGSWEMIGREPDTINATAVTAGSFVTGTRYRITTVGSTDYKLVGAEINAVGVAFTATGSGSGTGTVNEITDEGLVNVYVPTSTFTVVNNTASPLRA